MKEVINAGDETFNDIDAAMGYIDGITLKSNYEEVFNILEDIINNSQGFIDEKDREILLRNIKNTSEIKAHIK